jgi:hypothetical protein
MCVNAQCAVIWNGHGQGKKNSALFKIAQPFWKRYGSYSVLIARYFSK